MRAFVTGGAGFLGRQVVARLLEQGHDAVCLLRQRSNAAPLEALAAAEGRLEVLRGHLGQPDTYSRALSGCDVVFHVAAEMKGAVAVLFMTNVIATRALMRASHDAGVRRFVLVSSFGVYGGGTLPAHALLDETCPLDPHPHLRDPYSYSKVVQEQVAWEAHGRDGLPLVVVRPGVIYGPGRDWVSSRIGLRLGNLVLKMGGRQVVPYVYVDNCADAVVLAGAADGVEGEALNVLDDELPTANALLHRYRRDLGGLRVVPIPAWAIAPLSRTNEWYHRYSQGQLPAVLTCYRSDAHWKPLRYTNAKAKRLLGWTPAVSVDEGLRRTAASLRVDAAQA